VTAKMQRTDKTGLGGHRVGATHEASYERQIPPGRVSGDGIRVPHCRPYPRYVGQHIIDGPQENGCSGARR